MSRGWSGFGRCPRSWRVLGAALLVLGLAAPAAALELDGREVLLDWHPPVLPGGGVLSQSVELPSEWVGVPCALFLADEGESAGWWRVSVNGRPLQGDPLVTPAGAWFLVAGDLIAGDSLTVEVSPGLAGLGGRVGRMVLFPLDGTGEEAHFGAFVRTQQPRDKAQPPADPAQLAVDMLHLDWDITLAMARNGSNEVPLPAAVATHRVRSLADGLATCVLDFNDNNGRMVVSAVLAGASPDALVPVTATYDSAAKRLRIPLPEVANTGDEFSVRVVYSGVPIQNISWRMSTHNGSVPLHYTDFQPYDARHVLPCKDIPEDKFTSTLRIAVPDVTVGGYPYFAVSVGALADVAVGGGQRVYTWENSYPVASYLLSVTCTNYRPATGVYTSRDGRTTMEVGHYVLPQSWAAESPEVARTIEVMDFFADTFGEYPFLREKYWTSTWGLTFGMEHQTATSMPDGNLATPYHRRNIHELAHMWFGDMITCRHYDHLWLNEGWATYCEALFEEHRLGRAAYHTLVNNWTTLDTYPIVSTNADSFDTRIVYRKAGFVLHTLRYVMGDDAFFAGTRAYLADPALAYGTALTADFARHMSEAAGEDMTWFFDQWMYQAARPSYQWYWQDRPGDTGAELLIGIRQTQGGIPYTLPIEFRVVYTNGESETIRLWNRRATEVLTASTGGRTVASVTFDPDNYILETNTRLTQAAAVPAPTLVSLRGDGAAGTATLRWGAGFGPGLQGYRLYGRPLGGGGAWQRLADESVLGPAADSHTLTNLAPGAAWELYLTTVSTAESVPSDTYAFRLGAGPARWLIVDGYDRLPSGAAAGTPHALVPLHGEAIAAIGDSFDSAANEAIGDSVALGDYALVDWLLAEESTADETFSTAEQALVANWLRGGGRLLVSGNEVGWDLDDRGSPTDKAFYADYLKADYVADKSGVYTVSGIAGTAFEGWAATFGGAGAAYTPGYPDVIAPVGGAATLVQYTGGAGAAVGWAGTFPGGTAPGAVVYFGFALETIANATERAGAFAAARRVLLPEPPLPMEGMLAY